MIKINKKFVTSLITAFTALLSVFVIVYVVESAENNATLSLQKTAGSGLFTLKMSDAQGIKGFALVFPTDKFPYSGDFGGCPRGHSIDKISIEDPKDFNPLMNAVILDCQGNETEFEIAAPVNGVAQVKKAGIAPPSPPPPPPATEEDTASSLDVDEEETEEETAVDPLADIQYPIKELGDCSDKESCEDYCDQEVNLDRCLAYAEEHGLLKHSELERGKKFAQIVKAGGGPGGCTTERECFGYCNDVDRIDECVAFAEKNGFMEEDELEEAKKIQSIVKSGKSLPGNCKNRIACEAYCKNLEHMDECIAFAKEAGFMSAEEIAEAEKFLPLMKSGQTPGGCKSKEECEAFCEAEDNFAACFDFADKAGLITDKEREIMKKTGGKGPGGCRGRACQTFCEDPANQKACFEFGKEYGLISESDLARMEEGKRMLKEQLETGPPEIRDCLKSVVDVTVLESEGFAGGPELGEKMRKCFETLIPQGMQGQFEFGEGGEFHGPGGCASREECEAYCKSNPEACGFGGGGGPGGGGGGPGGGGFPGGVSPEGFPGGGIPSGESYVGPGGCTSREECEVYCKSNPEKCGGFGPSSSGTGVAGPCDWKDFHPVCGQGGVSYNSACVARGHGVEVAHEGACVELGHRPCEQVFKPVCGDKDGVIGNYYNACVAHGGNATVLYEGECKSAIPPPSEHPPPGQEQYQQQYQDQYQKQYEEQYRQQYEQQYQQQLQNQTPPGYIEAGQAPPPTFGDMVGLILTPILWLLGF